ncbi:MAG TPA: sugar-binding domain-containing protein [Candidatus Margulisiibacteriota bacterium]|nr:sugar-binding domain-containing protein [Candidatus Margulisiibacteriota bacterium]
MKRRKKRRGITKDPELLPKVALAKFPPTGERRMRSDREVAEIVGISIQAVGGLLEAAFNQGFTSAIHHAPNEVIELARLEDAVRLRYGLLRVLLVPGLPDMLEPLDVKQRRNVQTQVIRSMARRVIEYLDALLADAAARQEGFTLGVAWGRTMRLLAEHLRSTPRDVCFPGLEVVPIVGITCASLQEPTEANVIAMRFAEAYRGYSSQLACPAFVPRPDAWVMQRLEQVRRMLQKLLACDAVITSMGPIPDDDNAAEEITLSSDPVLNAALFKAARTREAIGEICFWLFNEWGEEVRTNHAAIGLGFGGLQKIAADPKRQVILVAGGDRRRFKPLRAALRARLASVLVSDTVTARFLAEEN